MNDLFGRTLIEEQSLDEIIELCKASPKGRSSLCMHTNSDELLKLMMICFSPLHTVLPHKNRSPGQIIYIAYKGEIQIGLEDNDRTWYPVSPENTKACAVDRSVFRAVKNPAKEYSAFWEITLGPHDNKSDTIWKNT